MKIAIIQPDTVWEDKKANFSNIEKMISGYPVSADLVVLPEMFSTGFSLNADILSEEEKGETFLWMKRTASNGNFSICGSFIKKSNEKYFNQFTIIEPEGYYEFYNKRHLFSLVNENRIFTPGNERKIFQLAGMRFLALICYDLRFPVWSRNRNDFEAIICIASWPDVRREAWQTLLKARAIENQCYVIGVNRTGVDNEGFKYAGDSVILNPAGKILAKVNDYEQGIATAEITTEELTRFREKFPFWKDADDFSINM